GGTGTGGTGPGDNPQAPDKPEETPGDEPEAPKDDHGPDGPVPTPDEPVKPKPAEPEAPLPGQLDLQIVSVSGAPQSNLEVELTLPDGSKRAGHTGSDGHFL